MRETLAEKVERRLRMTASSAALWGADKLSYRLGLRSPDSLTLPDFLGLGAQKAGSTWLWENLRCHPDLFLSTKKELHFFNLYFYRNLRTYASQFSEGAGKTKGEITPAYSILPPARIRFVRQIMPDVKLILILRNPIERAWSRAKMNLREPGDKTIDLERFSVRELHRTLTHPSSRARGDYLRIIDNWLTCFPPDQLHVCFYDDLSRTPREFLSGIFGFLGVRSDVDWSEFPYRTVSNPTPSTPIPDQYQRLLVDLYGEEIEGLYRRLGARIEHWRCT